MVMIRIELDVSAMPYGPEMSGTTQAGVSRFPFRPKFLSIVGVLDEDEEPRVSISGPRIIAGGKLSSSSWGETRMLWEHVRPEHRLEYFEKDLRHARKRLAIQQGIHDEALAALQAERERQGFPHLEDPLWIDEVRDAGQ